MTRLHDAYDEFVAEFCGRHEECQATREEAYELANKSVEIGEALATAVLAFGGDEINLEMLLESAPHHPDCEGIVFAAARAKFHA